MHFPLSAAVVRRALSSLAVPLLAALVLLCAVPADAESVDAGTADPGAGGEPADSGSGGPAGERVGASEYFTGLLAQEPEGAAVVVHDSLAGDYDPVELERSLHESFGRLDVPYYVVASGVPDYSITSRDFLAGLQDRMDEPGLYVHLRPQQSQVHAVTRQVDLPVREAGLALSLERAFTIYTPMDTMADTFVDTLTAPDLDERAKLRWTRTLPVSWWVESQLGALRLDTSSGPTQLGELTAAAAGAAVTLYVLLGMVRAGRRKQAEKAGYTGVLPGDHGLSVGRALTLGVGVVVVTASVVHLATATLPWEEQHHGPTPPSTAPYVASTVRVERIAEALSEDPLYVDPLARTGAQELTGTADRLAGAEAPVYTAVLSMSRTDESGGDPEVLAHALHHVMGEDGVFVVVDDTTGGGSPKVEVALFGVEAAGISEDRYGLWEVTGYRTDHTAESAAVELLDWLGDLSADPGQEAEVPDWAESRAAPPYERSRWSEFVSGRFYESLFLVGPLTGVLLLALAGTALGARGRLRAVPGRALRPQADRAVRRAVKALESAPRDHPGRNGAVREIDTALAVLGGQPDELDLVGIIVLAERAVRRLDPDPDTAAGADVPVCAVNPLHGRALVHGPSRPQPLCGSCAALPERERDHRTLRVRATGDKRVRHGELGRRWVTTGYGNRGRLKAEDLLRESDVH